MNEDTLRRLQIDVEKLQVLMHGDGMDGGFVNAVISLATVVQGTKQNPGGLVKQLEDQKEKIDKLFKIVWMGAGAAVVINILWIVFIGLRK